MSDLTTALNHARIMAGRSETSAKDAALWMQIAEEIDAYLHPQVDVDLFGELSEVPTSIEEPA